MEILFYRQAGGVRGNSPIGQNFGRVCDPQPTTISLPSGNYQTTVVHRSGALVDYAVEFFVIPSASIADLEQMIRDHYSIWWIATEGKFKIGADGPSRTDGLGWLTTKSAPHFWRINEKAGIRTAKETINAVLDKATALYQQEAQKKAREDENKAAKLQQAREAAEEYVNGKMPALYIGYTQYPTTGDAELDAAVLAERSRREAEIKEKEKAREVETEAKWNQMADWAELHGSPYLRRLIDGGYNWKDKCVKEWCEYHTPEGWADISKIPDFQVWWQIKNPSVAALDALDAAYEQFPNAEIDLYRAKFYNEDDGKYHVDYLSITLTPPIGQGYSVEKFIEHYEPAE
jgi:hypothetical protein